MPIANAKNVMALHKKGKLGGGVFSDVYLVEYKGEFLAAKEVVEPSGKEERERLARERGHHKTMSDKGKEQEDGYPMTVPEFKDYIADRINGVCYILMEKMPFSLDQLTVENKRIFPLTALDKLKIMYGIAKCMMYVHLEGIIHRDLKPENVLLDTDLGVRLCDFGFARKCNINVTMTQHIGTPLYEAPETYSDGHYDNKADVFSYGVLMYAMLCRDEQWVFESGIKATEPMITQKAIKSGQRYQQGDIGDVYWRLITRCWEDNPEDRPSFREIVEYFRTEFKDERQFRSLRSFKQFLAGVEKDIAVYEKIRAKKSSESK